MDLYQAFSQPPGPGRLWISLGAGLLDGPRKSTHTQKTDTNPFQDPQTLFAELDAHNSGRSPGAGGRPLRRRREMRSIDGRQRLRGTADVLSVFKVKFLQISCS
jgi:hypothetical protein